MGSGHVETNRTGSNDQGWMRISLKPFPSAQPSLPLKLPPTPKVTKGWPEGGFGLQHRRWVKDGTIPSQAYPPQNLNCTIHPLPCRSLQSVTQLSVSTVRRGVGQNVPLGSPTHPLSKLVPNKRRIEVVGKSGLISAHTGENAPTKKSNIPQKKVIAQSEISFLSQPKKSHRS